MKYAYLQRFSIYYVYCLLFVSSDYESSIGTGDKTSEYTVVKIIENIDEEVIGRYMSKFNEYLQDCEKRDVDAAYISTMKILGPVNR